VVVSDGRGDTCAQVVQAALVQFEDQPCRVEQHPNVRTGRDVERVVAKAAALRAVLFYTLVGDETRAAMARAARRRLVPAVDALGPGFSALHDLFRRRPQARPGLLYASNRERFDAANVPLVPGLPPPRELLRLFAPQGRGPAHERAPPAHGARGAGRAHRPARDRRLPRRTRDRANGGVGAASGPSVGQGVDAGPRVAPLSAANAVTPGVPTRIGGRPNASQPSGVGTMLAETSGVVTSALPRYTLAK
jgi:hypothetical protein